MSIKNSGHNLQHVHVTFTRRKSLLIPLLLLLARDILYYILSLSSTKEKFHRRYTHVYKKIRKSLSYISYFHLNSINKFSFNSISSYSLASLLAHQLKKKASVNCISNSSTMPRT